MDDCNSFERLRSYRQVRNSLALQTIVDMLERVSKCSGCSATVAGLVCQECRVTSDAIVEDLVADVGESGQSPMSVVAAAVPERSAPPLPCDADVDDSSSDGYTPIMDHVPDNLSDSSSDDSVDEDDVVDSVDEDDASSVNSSTPLLATRMGISVSDQEKTVSQAQYEKRVRKMLKTKEGKVAAAKVATEVRRLSRSDSHRARARSPNKEIGSKIKEAAKDGKPQFFIKLYV